MNRMALALYCLITCALSWAIQFAALAVAGDPESPQAGPWLAAAMLTPTLVALAFIALHRPARRGVMCRPRWRMLWLAPVAVAVPTLCAFATVAAAHLTGWGASGWFEFSAGGVTVSGGPWLLGRGAQDWAAFAANVALTGAAFALLNGVVAAGEEFGWRGFLQAPMIERFGMTRGVVIIGLVWAAWHLPAQLAGYNYPDYPLLGALVLSPLQHVAASFFLAWLTLRAGSFWPAAIAHGAGNSIQEGVVANIQLAGPRLAEDLTGLALEVAVGLVCWWALSAARGRGQGAACAPAGAAAAG
jgi:uncharacterized protein